MLAILDLLGPVACLLMGLLVILLTLAQKWGRFLTKLKKKKKKKKAVVE